MIPVILTGGSGTRLWPLSREAYPKQFLRLPGDDSLLQDTWQRVRSLATATPIVVAGEDHRFIVAEQLHEAGCSNAAILLEPVPRNTAPAIAVAALEAIARDGDSLLLVMPSDHAITDVEAFHRAVRAAEAHARDGALVTFGIPPTHPETGYGYIHAGSGEGVRKVLSFVEKPDEASASAYLESGDYVWNSGMFLFRASAYLGELERHEPEMAAACRTAWEQSRRDFDFIRLDPRAFAACKSDSIDYAVMERTDNAWVLPMHAGWSDVGSWAALRDLIPQDADGNALRGDVLARGCSGSLGWSDGRLLVMLGLRDVVVVETADAVLATHRDRAQDVKAVVAALKTSGRAEPSRHRKVYRPWGDYECIDAGGRFQVKRITVKPGAALSLQMHRHRAEHWVVVSGTARVTRGDEVMVLEANQSTYIPVGVKHRLENAGPLPLELIEVQSGEYLGEDDIVRFEDAYGRD